MYVCGHLHGTFTFNSPSLSLTYVSELSLIVSLSVFKSCTVSCTKETELGLQQVDVLSHLQNSEQAI